MTNEEKVTKERNELATKIKRLKNFMKSDAFKDMDHDDQAVMKAQKNAMQAYKSALDLRLFWGIY